MLKYRKVSKNLNFDKLWIKYNKELFMKIDEHLKLFFKKVLQFKNNKNF